MARIGACLRPGRSRAPRLPGPESLGPAPGASSCQGSGPARRRLRRAGRLAARRSAASSPSGRRLQCSRGRQSCGTLRQQAGPGPGRAGAGLAGPGGARPARPRPGHASPRYGAQRGCSAHARPSAAGARPNDLRGPSRRAGHAAEQGCGGPLRPEPQRPAGPKLVAELAAGPKLVAELAAGPKLVAELAAGPKLVAELAAGPKLVAELAAG